MSIAKSVFLSSLVLLLSAVAAAQEVPPPLLSPVAVPAGGVQLLVTHLDPSLRLASSVLVAPGGAAAAGSGVPSAQGAALPSPVLAQRFLTRYTDTAGWKHQLETTEQPGESPDLHALRHAAALAELVTQFPPALGAPATLAAESIQPGEQVLKTGWKGVDGLDHEVITARKPNENMDKWAERHADGVAALLKVFPPKPTFAAVTNRAPRVA